MRPIVELSRIPDAFANADHPLGFGGDVAGWSSFVAAFIRFAIDTYGLDEVRSWYFEFWNEPDHHLWAGDRPLAARAESGRRQIQSYLDMYDHTAEAALSVCPELRYGGPAISGNTVFLREFLHHCAEGRNAATGKTGARMDFVSFHCYSNSTDRLPAMENMLARIAETCADIRKAAEPRDVPILMDEWGATWGGGRTLDGGFPVEHRNGLRAATFTLKLIKELIRFDLDMALYWGFSEHTWGDTGGRRNFNGMRALWTRAGIARPALGAYRLLKRLFPLTVRVHRMVDTNNVDALATLAGNELRIALWHHDPDPLDAAQPSVSEIVIDGLDETLRLATLTLEGYTREHNTYAAWQALGRPDALDDPARARLDEAAKPKTIWTRSAEVASRAVTTGEFVIRPGEFYLLTVELA